MRFCVDFWIIWMQAIILIHIWLKYNFSLRSYRWSNINSCKFSRFEIPIFSVVKNINSQRRFIFHFWHRIWTELILRIFLNYLTKRVIHSSTLSVQKFIFRDCRGKKRNNIAIFPNFWANCDFCENGSSKTAISPWKRQNTAFFT